MQVELSQLSTTFAPSYRIWVAGYNAWLAASDVDREEFMAQRLDFFNNTVAVPNLGATCTSSGSTGAIKTYLYGPNMPGMVRLSLYARFFGRCSRSQEIKAIQPMWNAAGATEGPVSINFGIRNIKSLNAKIAASSTRIFSMTPTILQLLLNYGWNPGRLDPEDVVFSTTGEYCSPELKATMLDYGHIIVDHMRCYDGGLTFTTCPQGNTHVIDFFSANTQVDDYVETIDPWNLAQKFVDYNNGDLMTYQRGERCLCGLPIDTIEFQERPTLSFEIKGKTYSADRIAGAFARAALAKNTTLLFFSIGYNYRGALFHYQCQNPAVKIKIQDVSRSLRLPFPVRITTDLPVTYPKTLRVYPMS